MVKDGTNILLKVPAQILESYKTSIYLIFWKEKYYCHHTNRAILLIYLIIAVNIKIFNRQLLKSCEYDIHGYIL